MLARKALAGTAAAPKVYVEDVFSTYLYTGNGSTQTITNNIDLSTEGGLVWFKARSGVYGTGYHSLFDTARGVQKIIYTNVTNAQNTYSDSLTAFNTNGFTLGADTFTEFINANTAPMVSWTFRKAKKFFDVVTYTGNGSTQAINHNLGSTPGCVIVKRTNDTGNWFVWHRSLSAGYRVLLNATNAQTNTNSATFFGNNTTYVDPTSTNFTVGNETAINNSGDSFVAYLFAHDAGGFGDAGSDSIIKCGSYTGTGSSGNTVTLDWEPQWLMIKASSTTGGWQMLDNMRGMPVGSEESRLTANSSAAEDLSSQVSPTATGFILDTAGSPNSSGVTYIYIAIRRGPMKTPTSGTEVFQALTYAGDGSGTTGQTVNTAFPMDFAFTRYNRSGAGDWDAISRLQGLSTAASSSPYLNPYNTNAEATGGYLWQVSQTQLKMYGFSAATTQLNYLYRRAPGFFDVVCYTGTGSATTVSHNLGVAPELMIVKIRSTSNDWYVWHTGIGNNEYLLLNGTAAKATSTSLWNNTAPTSTNFSVGAASTNTNGETYVAYLFASCPGVSKVGTYTGNGSSVTVTTDFQPRFVMVKRTDSTGNWIVGDSARGLPTGNDPALFLNTTAAETTGQDWVDVSSTSFTVNETALNANVNTATYLYLAVA